MTTDILSQLLPRIRQFIDSEVIPLESAFLSKPWRELEPTLQAKRQMVRSAGMWGLALPPEIGGQGLTLAEFGRVSEELGRTPLGHYVFNCQAPDIGNTELLLEYGSPQQKDRWLMPLVRGEIRSCFSMTEPEHAGSNPTWMSTTAVQEGDEYVINGHKWYTTAADGAAFAIVMAVTNPNAESRHQRASQIIVPLDTPGFTLVRNIAVMGESGEGWPTHGEVTYENVRVPVSNRIGEEGAGFALAQQRLGPGRIHHCMRWIGICERAFDLMCSHAAHRQVAPGRTLGEQGIVQAWIAESRAEINASRLLVLETAGKIDEEGSYAARDEISLIKFYVAGVINRVLDRALQTLGGLGMSDDTPIAWWYRHERAARIYDGPDEVHKISVARRILKRY
ncbi:MAG: acyl-CoA dehydrogenase family protein [Caldilineaceae bacterium]|nr:acyl-CoA dehydrogenase family protein [Caldilineaceae bacterium]HRJ42709.1 acyl-CoA dehydrogenase family protein [Caldilineaceae bacterium]